MREEQALSQDFGNCPACGYANAPGEVRCEKCGRRFAGPQRFTAKSNLYQLPKPASSEPALRAAVRTPDDPAPRPKHLPAATRTQIKGRVHAFRARRMNSNLPLAFEPEPLLEPEEMPAPVAASDNAGAPEQEMATTAANGSAAAPACPVVENTSSADKNACANRTRVDSGKDARVTVAPAPPRLPRHTPPKVTQPEFNFPSLDTPAESFGAFQVAPVRLRMVAHAADLALTLAALFVFLIPFRVLAGSVTPTRVVLGGIASAYLLLLVLYGLLFLCGAGATPAMNWLGLRVVDFNGSAPPRQQLFYRFLGAIASAGSFFLGFFWAAVDEEKLSWHDRISKTFLVVAEQGSK